MKKILLINIILLTATLLFAQNIGDRKPQSEVFAGQPTWKAKKNPDTVRHLTVQQYIACKDGDQVLFWNAIEKGMAEVQSLKPTDSIVVVTIGGIDYLYKEGCYNRLSYIKVISPCPPVKPCDTIRIEKTDSVIVNNYIYVKRSRICCRRIQTACRQNVVCRQNAMYRQNAVVTQQAMYKQDVVIRQEAMVKQTTTVTQNGSVKSSSTVTVNASNTVGANVKNPTTVTVNASNPKEANVKMPTTVRQAGVCQHSTCRHKDPTGNTCLKYPNLNRG